MGKRVIWKKRPLRQVRAIENYLRIEFGGKSVDDFLAKMERKMEQLCKYPDSGHLTRFKTVRRVRIGKHNSFYYRVSGSKLIILFIWDGRMEPEKNPYG